MAQALERVAAILRKSYAHIGRVVGVTPVNAGHISKTFKIATYAPGAYILKVKPGHLFDPHTTVEMHRYLAFLKARGLPVPGIIATAEGRSVELDGSTIYELQEYIEHDGDLDDCEYAEVSRQIFTLLGRTHRISTTYPGSFAQVAYLGDSKLPIGLFAKYFGGALEYAIPRGIELASGDRTHREALLAHLEFFAETLRTIQAEIQCSAGRLPQTINHNDIYGNNLLFREGRLVGLVDWDFCTTEVYYLDLVEALHYSALLQAGERTYFGLPADGEIRVGHAVGDLRAYLAENPELAYDGRMLAQLLIAKVISLAFFPPFEVYPQVEERLEMHRRVRKVILSLQDLGEFEL